MLQIYILLEVFCNIMNRIYLTFILLYYLFFVLLIFLQVQVQKQITQFKGSTALLMPQSTLSAQYYCSIIIIRNRSLSSTISNPLFPQYPVDFRSDEVSSRDVENLKFRSSPRCDIPPTSSENTQYISSAAADTSPS